MKPQMMAIWDKKAACYQAPFTVRHIALGIRWFKSLSMEQGHDVQKWPDDYDLYWVGAWDDETGKLEPKTPECVMSGSNLANLEMN